MIMFLLLNVHRMPPLRSGGKGEISMMQRSLYSTVQSGGNLGKQGSKRASKEGRSELVHGD